MKMKKYLCLIIVFVIMLVCSSCRTVKKDIEKLAMVLSVGYDYIEDDKYMLTAQVLKITREQTSGTTNGENQQKSVPSEIVVYTSVGETIIKAFDNLTTTLGQEPYFAHNKFIVIGKQLAGKSIALLVDSNLRGHQSRPNIPVLVAKGKANEIIKQLTPMDTIPANTVENIIESQFKEGLVTITDLKEVYNGLANKTAGITTGVIYLEKDVDGAHNGKIFRVEGTAIFKEDKLIGFLTKEETKAMLWIKGKVKSGDVVVNSPKNEEEKITLEILNSKSKIKPIIVEDNYLMKIHIDVSSNIVSMIGKYDPMNNYKILEELEEVQNKIIEKQIEFVINKVQEEYKVDIFNFGEIIHKKYPEEWNIIREEWDEIFPNILFEVKVNSSIKRPGLISKPAY